jgi:tRNA pseudouridine55 synthase
MAQRPRRPQLKLHGVLLLDKPTGLTSNTAVQRVRHLLCAHKAGHTGSLDPLASGVLPICLGEATKLAGYLLDTDKRYRTTIRLGTATDSADATGQVIFTAPIPPLDSGLLESVLDGFRGTIDQIPPMYSALKQRGVRLYELARRGIEVERQSRRLDIHELRLVGFTDETLELDVHCSKGTYIRVLAEDIGRALGCGAHVETLRRTAVGPWTLSQAHPFDALEALTPSERLSRIVPMDRLVPDLPIIDCDDTVRMRLQHGQPVPAPGDLPDGPVRLYDTAAVFFGIGSVVEGTLAPRRMFNLDSPSAVTSVAVGNGSAPGATDPTLASAPCPPATGHVKIPNCL